MKKYFIPHKVKNGDITHLADNDSFFAISHGIREENYIEVQAPNGKFLAQVTYIQPKSVEVEIKSIIEEKNDSNLKITILQSVSNISKFGNFLEKITELGVFEIIPIISELSIPDRKIIEKDRKLWFKIIDDASQQSRNYTPPKLSEVRNIDEISKLHLEGQNFCFVTENVKTTQISNESFKEKNLNLAFGPESGWSVEDIAIFKKNNFQFINLKGNILRTETTPIVATSIIKFIHKEL